MVKAKRTNSVGEMEKEAFRCWQASQVEKEEIDMGNDWKRYEKRKSRSHRGKHVGGSGKPDYVRGGKRGEVKHRKSPLTKPEVMSLAKKGIDEIESLSGYTAPAKKYVCKYRPNLKLYKKGRRVKCQG